LKVKFIYFNMKLFLLLLLTIPFNSIVFAQNKSIILGRPTDNSITASILFDQNVIYYLEYGTQSGSYPNVSSTVSIAQNVVNEVELTGLFPDTKYYYRVQYKFQGASIFSSSEEYSFHTQRIEGSSFSFVIEADEHLYDKKGVKSIYQITLDNEAADNPDFMLSLGDIFGDDHTPTTITSGALDTLHKDYRPFLGSICHSIPFFVCLGNHEGEMDYYLSQNPPNNLAAWGTIWRNYYYPNPIPSSFYSGNQEIESFGIGSPKNYYSWTWGNALFVVMDVYRYQSLSDTTAKPLKWDWTLGQAQYDWLKNTLESSTSEHKFVFAHHVSGQGRGGINQARFYEWGGYEQNGTTYNFPTKRPNMAKPIHQLFVDNGVDIFFQGHDHLFAHEVMNGVTYQEVPMAADSTYQIGMLANADAYVSDTLDGTGHIRVNVSPTCIQVDFVRAFLPADTLTGHHNREVAFSYTIGTCSNGINENQKNVELKVAPNPANNEINLLLTNEKIIDEVEVYNILGEKVIKSNSCKIDCAHLKYGIYYIIVKCGEQSFTQKVFINH
jgi:hypothetical protein